MCSFTMLMSSSHTDPACNPGYTCCHVKGERTPTGRHLGLRSTRITESPRRNSLGMKRSLFTGVDPFLPLPVLGICVRTAGRQACDS